MQDDFYYYRDLAEKDFGKGAFIWWIASDGDILLVGERSERKIFVLDEKFETKKEIKIDIEPVIVSVSDNMYAVSDLFNGKVKLFDKDFKEIMNNINISNYEMPAFFFGKDKNFLIDFQKNKVSIISLNENPKVEKEFYLKNKLIYDEKINKYDLRVIFIKNDVIHCADKEGVVYKISEEGIAQEVYRPKVDFDELKFWMIENGIYYAIDNSRNILSAEKINEPDKYKIKRINSNSANLRMGYFDGKVVYTEYKEKRCFLKMCEF